MMQDSYLKFLYAIGNILNDGNTHNEKTELYLFNLIFELLFWFFIKNFLQFFLLFLLFVKLNIRLLFRLSLL